TGVAEDEQEFVAAMPVQTGWRGKATSQVPRLRRQIHPSRRCEALATLAQALHAPPTEAELGRMREQGEAFALALVGVEREGKSASPAVDQVFEPAVAAARLPA